MKIGQGVFEVRGLVRVKNEVGSGVGGSLMVIKESNEEEAVGQEYLPIHLALGRTGPVVKQTWVIVDLGVFYSQPGGCQGCWLMIRLVVSNH